MGQLDRYQLRREKSFPLESGSLSGYNDALTSDYWEHSDAILLIPHERKHCPSGEFLHPRLAISGARIMNARLLLQCMTGLLIVSFVPVLLAADPPLGNAQAFFTALGDLPGGPFESSANAISPDGTVVVGYGRTYGGFRAFRWADGAMTELAGLPTENVEASEAYGATAKGRIVVGNLRGFDFVERVFIWNDGQVTYIYPEELGTLGVRASAVSYDGTVIVGLATNPGEEAYLWNQGAVTHLGTLGQRSYARDVSRDGSRVIGFGDFGSSFRGILWTDGMIGALETPQDSVLGTRAYAISADGHTVVGSAGRAIPSQSDAVRWDDGHLSRLPRVNGTVRRCSAGGVSAAGEIIVGSCFLGQGNGSVATVWDRWSGARRIPDVLEEDFGLDLNGFTVSVATDVSDDGTTIVGYGSNRDGWQEAWLARIPLTLPVIVDVRPNKCPNWVNARSHGSLKVVIVGSEEVDLTHLDPASIKLSGMRGPQTGSVLPEVWWRGSSVRLRDVTSTNEAPCECADVDAGDENGAKRRSYPDRHGHQSPKSGAAKRVRDGYLDAELRFSIPAIVRELKLDQLHGGDTIPVKLFALLDDGTPIVGSDCVVIQSKRRGHRGER